MSESEQDTETQMQGMLTRWQTLKTQAESGELRLDTEIGTALARHAQRMSDQLSLMMDRASSLAFLSGFGTLQSADALRNKFAQKANNGNDSAVKRLQQSIDVVTLMKETYELAIGKLQESDQSAADKLAALNMGGA
ncbi:hypothetical protein NONI108955_40260 [Nocardia ninae]|uniref:Uncharacterized protein n=1 Tax=Nocardia ninae NBRC 108245 TaxID=1210091 RepID=A0A511MJ22_9NOCA|nr:hypothetical protein [Nocardia ninae]GEM40645.1 hypothetical protein NN4_51640 [Nocardia ninae NBRC 108245]